MFAVVVLFHSRKKLTVPISWIKSLDITQIFNYGISKTKNHTVFYAPEKTEPDFSLDIKENFDENANALYICRIRHIWDSYENAIEYMESSRPILPAIYNHNRERYHWDPPMQPNNYIGNVKIEPIEGLLWPANEMFIELSDDENENQNENENKENDEQINLHIDALRNNEDNDAELKNILVRFPDTPNQIIDITEEDRIIIQFMFASDEDDNNLQSDCLMTYEEPIAQPMIKSEIDSVLGCLPFERNSDGYSINEILISNDLYEVLKVWNQLYKMNSLFDRKFMNMLIIGTIGMKKLGENIDWKRDRRRKTFDAIFGCRVDNDAARMSWLSDVYWPNTRDLIDEAKKRFLTTNQKF